MRKILVVDDVDSVRSNIARTLVNEGYEVKEASNGTECLKYLRESKYDLIILDIMMPQKGGIDTLVEIKNFKDLKKIIITGMVLPESDAFQNLVKHYGAKSILYKPFKQQQLLDAINDAFKI